MKVAILGLGYVGCVSSACLARQGHQVVGVDVNPVKTDLINEGKSPIVEQGLDTLIAEVVGEGRLTATTDPLEAVVGSEVSLICVGTPGRENGSLDLRHVGQVSGEIGDALAKRDGYHVVAVRSTMLPGSVESVVVPAVEDSSGKKAGKDFGVCINPEFLREGSALSDYHDPPFTLIGGWDERSGKVLEQLYTEIGAPILHTGIRAAEMVKYASNAFHALKVTFANELGLICKQLDVDSHEVMDIFLRDKQLNVSGKYLKPGFAFGGSCLPKDVRALLHRARMLDLDPPVLNAILPSNERHIDHAFRMIQRTGNKRVGILGLSFKAGTDDLRESPLVGLVERLLGKGYQVRIYDQNVSLAAIMGSNKDYIHHVIPHISTLLVDDGKELLDHAEVLVVGNDAPELRQIVSQAGNAHRVIDLVRIGGEGGAGKYQGICW